MLEIKERIPSDAPDKKLWQGLLGAGEYQAIAAAAEARSGFCLLLCNSSAKALEAEDAIRFFLKDSAVPLFSFPDWETLPYDQFSPHQDIISQRLESLASIPKASKGLLITSVSTLMHLLPPKDFVQGRSFILNKGDSISLEEFKNSLVSSGYRASNTVFERGEFATRGSIFDIYPMGADTPIRIELFDDEIESLRSFDPETQRTIDTLEKIKILPAKEFPFDETSQNEFRLKWQEIFDVDPRGCPIHEDVKNGIIPSGIEYYLKLFFEECNTLWDYLPKETLLIHYDQLEDASKGFWSEINERYENLRWDVSRPLLSPKEIFFSPDNLLEELSSYARIELNSGGIKNNPQRGQFLFDQKALPELNIDHHSKQAAEKFAGFYREIENKLKVLIVVESAGRRESLLDILKSSQLYPEEIQNPFELDQKEGHLFIAVGDIVSGSIDEVNRLAIVSETELFGATVLQKRKSRSSEQSDSDFVIKSLSEIEIGNPVVHLDHGIGRYLGLVNLIVDEQELEFLCLEYAKEAKLYVPVSSLQLISRYAGGADEHAPLHSLGSDQWQKAKKKASEKIHDVAAELLNVYAQRESQRGFEHKVDSDDYRMFSADFPFEETEDQVNAINACISDMESERPMDRLVCGDVGFGKTEVAMRAAFVAVQNHKQVAVLVPTTLLSEQHGESFKDRFAKWPFRIETLSRFKTSKEQKIIIEDLNSGKIDIIIGTHKILQRTTDFKNLGLIIIDEEHRFGVRHKEILKSMRTNVDILTLTATPIPRTLNMAMTGIRDISIIATPPAKRLSIKTFVKSYSSEVLKEAIHRELLRGGQVFYLHNEVSTIEQTAEEIQLLIPEARINIAHGQMREKQLENVMSNFYHKQSNVLICTTIIETGIDIPSANTIIIERADKLGLAQLHQLRGRVGRSHHQAYAYLLTPHAKAMSSDALKRLDAIQDATELGAGFTLASHDMEIRGAGEILGDEQSGNMHTIGFTLYMDMLEETVQAIKEGATPNMDMPFKHGCEINLRIPALIPDEYLPDVHNRLLMYKRISNAPNQEALREIEVEMIDRFGLLTVQIKYLLRVTLLKLKAEKLGILKIDAGPEKGKIEFNKKPKVDPIKIVNLVQQEPHVYKMDGADKLQFIFDMESYDDRISKIDQFLSRLSGS